jgi:predicted permease
MHSVFADLRHASRTLKASPGLVVVSVLSLGLGLGVNLTLFTAIEGIFWYEPTIAEPERVVSVQPGNSNQLSYLNYRDLRDSHIFESVAGYRRMGVIFRGEGPAESLSGIVVTPNFFEFLGVPLAAGRPFSEAEAMPERQPRMVVLSHRFWMRRFGGDTTAIGRELTLNGESFAVIGVLPEVRPVAMLEDPDIYVPISQVVLPTVNDRNNGNALAVLGRLRGDMTREQARAAVTTLAQRLEGEYPADNADMGRPAQILPLRGGDLAGSSVQLIVPAVAMALFGLVLLSACANVAGLLLARAAGRQREIALRFALGASRTQVVRLLFAESFGLAVLGTIAGAILSLWVTNVLNTVSFNGSGLNVGLAPSGSLAAYGLALLTATGLLAGLAPALRTTKPNITAAMQSGGSAMATQRLRLRHAFVVGQVAACMILLVLSSLMLRTLTRIASMDPGFDIERGLVAIVGVDPRQYAVDGGLALGERLAERIQAIAGVEAVSFANMRPLGVDFSRTRLTVAGESNAAPGALTYVNSVGPRYFATLGIPIVRGRDFSPGERQGSPPVAIVTESFERAYFQGRSALGQRVRRSDAEPYAEIVGVVRDHMFASYGDSSIPVYYTSYLQQPRVSTQVRPLILQVRVNLPPAAMLRQVQQAIADVDPTVLAGVITMRDATGSEAGRRRLVSTLLGSAAVLGLGLAMIGLYGMMAYVVATRTPEIGVRVALGATAAQVLGGVLAQGMRLVGVGLAIGAAVSLAVAQLARSLLAGLSPADPIAFGGTAAFLTMVAIAACYAPARRASRVDPIVALRRL